MSTSSCVTQEVEDDTRRGNFEALWRTLDTHYCFFDYKKESYGLDWNKVYEIEKTGTVAREDGSKYELKKGTKFKILSFRIKNKEDSLHGVACYIKIQELKNKNEYWIDGEKTPDFIEGGNINGTDLVWDELT